MCYNKLTQRVYLARMRARVYKRNFFEYYLVLYCVDDRNDIIDLNCVYIFLDFRTSRVTNETDRTRVFAARIPYGGVTYWTDRRLPGGDFNLTVCNTRCVYDRIIVRSQKAEAPK